MAKRKWSFGTVIRNTFRPEDLIEAFVKELWERGLSGPRNAARWVQAGTVEENVAKMSPREAYEIVDDLIFRLNADLPLYVYFGSHPGATSDYGYWVNLEALEEDVEYGDVVKVYDPNEVPSQGRAMVVNDHGNVSFYLDGKLVWDMV